MKARLRLALLAGVTLAGCTEAQSPSAKRPEVMVVAPGDPGSRGATLTLGQKQHYNSNLGAADRTILEDGVDVTLEPMDDAYATDSTDLGKGVVIARMINHSKTALQRLGLAPGATTYWLVYRKDGKLLSDFVADVPDSSYDRKGVETMMHRPDRPWHQSISQWQLPGPVEGMGAGAVLTVTDNTVPWTTCSAFGCCKPGN
jgi:hypothetical protein